MTPQELRDRTDRFSVDVIIFCPGEFAKLSIAVEEADEGVGWLGA